MFVSHLVDLLVTRKEVSCPPKAGCPDLVDLDPVTVETYAAREPERAAGTS
jgi:hypothetical protein